MIKQFCGFNVDVSYKTNMKTIRFRFKDGLICVTCPKISDKKIEKYIKDNIEFFNEKLNESLLSDDYTYILGKKYNIVKINENYNNLIIEEDKILVTKGKEEKLIKEFFINDVTNYIKFKEDFLRECFNTKEFPSFKVKKLKSSFGQYNKKTNTVTLDYRLAKCERIYLYLTLCHEMCHTIHFDHSKEFYNLLDNFVADSKKMHKLLKQIKMNDIF